MSDARQKTFPRLTGKQALTRLGAIPQRALPIVIDKTALDQVLEFSDLNPNVEVGGFLLGDYCHDARAEQSYIEVTQYVSAIKVDSSYRSLVFTHDSWARLHQQLRTQYSDRQVVGWHHTHPGFGIFLSRQDEFIHRHFFSQPWQVALVVDPRRGELGFFQWRDDEIVDAGFLVRANGKRPRELARINKRVQ